VSCQDATAPSGTTPRRTGTCPRRRLGSWRRKRAPDRLGTAVGEVLGGGTARASRDAPPQVTGWGRPPRLLSIRTKTGVALLRHERCKPTSRAACWRRRGPAARDMRRAPRSGSCARLAARAPHAGVICRQGSASPRARPGRGLPAHSKGRYRFHIKGRRQSNRTTGGRCSAATVFTFENGARSGGGYLGGPLPAEPLAGAGVVASLQPSQERFIQPWPTCTSISSST
jgi:hypothetical protein